MLAVVLVLVAAVLGAFGLVLLRKATESEPRRPGFSLGLLWLLITRRPVWAAGIVTVVVGFGFQVAALDNGPVTLVQLIVVMELPFALILARVVLGGRLRKRDWTAVGLMTAGVILMLFCLAPAGGTPVVGTIGWAVGLVVTAVVVVALLLAGRRSRPVRRTAIYGAAAGVVTGLTAVLVKAVASALRAGPWPLVSTWQTWVLVAVAVAGFLLLQNALQAGRLAASQPGITLANPLVAVVWGVLVLGEEVRGGAWVVGTLAGAVLLASGVVLLAGSPLLEGHTERGH